MEPISTSGMQLTTWFYSYRIVSVENKELDQGHGTIQASALAESNEVLCSIVEGVRGVYMPSRVHIIAFNKA